MSHAKLSPSGAHRWMNCTASPDLEATLQDVRSVYADRGSFGHAVAEFCLSNGCNPDVLVGVPEWEASEHFDHELREAVHDYVQYVRQRFADVRAKAPGATLLIEQQLDLTGWVPESWGTADAVILADGVLEVIDLKLGKGVAVEAEDNPQLKLYLLGAYGMFSNLYEINRVRGTIYQPFLRGPVSHEMPLLELLTWGREVQDIALVAFHGPGEFVPGEHCRFCRAASICRARTDYHNQLAQKRFQLVGKTLRLDEVAKLLPQLDQIVAWASDLKDYALNMATQGHVVPGYKLVEGRANRRYTDGAAVVTKLVKAGYAQEAVTETQLLGIQAMEKLLGRAEFASLLGDLVEKSPGKPVLAPIGDKRPEISSVADAAAVFKPIVGDQA